MTPIASAQGQIFQAPEAFWAGSEAIWVATGDFNGDGKNDMAVTDYNAGTVSVLLGNGDGTFSGAVAYAVGSGPTYVVAGDFNGDGKPDLAVINSGSGTVSVLLANGNGTFQTAMNYAVVPGASFMVAGDFNGDGKLDLIVNGGRTSAPSGYYEEMSILLGKGDGTFQPAVNYQTGFYRRVNLSTYSLSSSWIAMGDFNGDGKPDLLLAAESYTANCSGGVPPKCTYSHAYFLEMWLGNGDGTFQSAPNCCSYGVPLGLLAIGDFNGDGKLDVAAVNSNGAVVFLNNGTAGFQAPVTYAAGGNPTAITASDLDGNGTLDLVVTNKYGGVSVLLGKGDGTFQPANNYAAGADLWMVAAADFNGDGKPDLAIIDAVVNVGVSTVTVLLNQGNGAFGTGPQYGGTTPLSLTAADFNGDGKLDLAVADYSSVSPGISVMLGIGNGTYEPAVLYAAGKQPSSVAYGDFNRDHKLDLVGANSGGGVSVTLGNGDGTFQTAVSYATVDAGTYPSVVAGDLNGDGKPDLVVTDGNGHADVLVGNGDGTFKAAVSYTVGQACPSSATVPCLESPALGDFNGDGKLDLAVPDIAAGTVDVLLGNGDGTFQPTVSYSASWGTPNAVVAGDFNGDGKLDLAVAASNGEQVLLGNGDGTFQAPVYYTTGCCPTALVTGDFNGDGKLDIAAIGNGELTLLLGNGDGTFQVQFYAAGDQFSADGIVAGDFNGDHALDLVVTGGLSNSVPVLLNKVGFFAVVDAPSNGGTVTSDPAGIDCGTTCSANFALGTAVTLTATPAAGFGFEGWTGACSGVGTCSVTMKAGESATATFHPVFDLSVTNAGTGSGTVASNPVGISCGGTCSANFLSGSMVTLSETPAAGSFFAGWSGACSGTGTCTVMMNAAQAVTATFNALYVLSVTEAGTGSGTVTSIPAGISCGGTCSANFLNGTMVTLSEVPATGSFFAGWSGACSGTGTCTITMNAAQAVTATFNQPISVAISPSSVTISEGSTQVLNATLKYDPQNLGVTFALRSSCDFGPACHGVLTQTSPTSASYAAPSTTAGSPISITATSVADSTKSAEATITISGAAPNFAVSPASTSMTLQSGGQGSDVITIAPQNGFFGNAVQLMCAVAGPTPQPTCGLSTSSLTPDASSVASTLTVTAPTIAAMQPLSRPRFGIALYATWLPLIFGMVAVGGQKRRAYRGWAFGGFLAMLLFLQMSCAATHSMSNQGAPPPTNYTVTVTATSGAITHSTQVAVMVQ